MLVATLPSVLEQNHGDIVIPCIWNQHHSTDERDVNATLCTAGVDAVTNPEILAVNF